LYWTSKRNEYQKQKNVSGGKNCCQCLGWQPCRHLGAYCLDKRCPTASPRLDLLRPQASLRFIFKNPNFTTVIACNSVFSKTFHQLAAFCNWLYTFLPELDSSNCFLTTVFMSWKLTTFLKETLNLAPDGFL
jgi:hypothetical protein